MKKILLVTGLFLLIYGSNFCLAGEFDFQVKEDRYGGIIYGYLDRSGNRCMTNSMDYLSQAILLAQNNQQVSQNGTHIFTANLVLAKNDVVKDSQKKQDSSDLSDEYEDNETIEEIADPLEPMNRFFFHFNDKLYFYFLKPVASGYKKVVPSPLRVSIGNFFDNIMYPIRFVSCLFQGRVEGAAVETGRFILNSTGGIAGLFDPAEGVFEGEKYDEDLGQAMGSWGLGHGFYLDLPFFGPSSLRDGVGTIGGIFLDPLNYLYSDFFWDRAALKGVNVVNKTSFRIGDYEDLKEASIDPYVAIRDAYFQLRAKEVAE